MAFRPRNKGLFRAGAGFPYLFPGIWASISGGTTSGDATWNYRTFTGNGTLTVTRAGWIAYLVQGGGGAAGDGQSGVRYDAGGAGGTARYDYAYVTPGNISVTVGAGGLALNPSQNGTDGGAGGSSQLGSIATAAGGEGGGTDGAREGGDNTDYTGTASWGSNGSGHGAGAGGNAGSTNGGPGITWINGLEYGGGGAGGDNSGGSSSTTSHGGGDYGQAASRPGAGSGAQSNQPGAAGIVIAATPVDPLYVPVVTVNFAFTGGSQSWTVPANITSINVDMTGAEGADNSPAAIGGGGLGARVQATIPVTPGESLQINVGGFGTTTTGFGGGPTGGGFNGGGNAWPHTGGGTSGGGGGGGATDLRRGGTALTDRKLVAGGGGGDPHGFGGGDGGHGGGTTGQDGTTNSGTTQMGLGGTQSSGGAAGTNVFSNAPTAGSLGQGGQGAGGSTTSGAGGGGGYYGGGGGGGTTGGTGGGGGGSSYADPAATNVTHTRGYRAGNGYVTITYTLALA